MEQYLIRSLGEDTGKRIWTEVSTQVPSMALSLPAYKSSMTRKSALKILPVIALYKTLQKDGRADAFDIAYRYMIDVVGAANNRKFRSLEKLPGFFGLYKSVYWFILHHNEMCDYAFGEKKADRFNFFVTRCLWLDVCTQFGVPELTRCWCDCDTAGFKDMRKLEFLRSVTLAGDGKPCDYCFVKKG